MNGIESAIRNAASAACKALDVHYPGGDGGGITSNFQGVLEEVIAHMIRGKDPLAHSRGYFISLPDMSKHPVQFEPIEK